MGVTSYESTSRSYSRGAGRKSQFVPSSLTNLKHAQLIGYIMVVWYNCSSGFSSSSCARAIPNGNVGNGFNNKIMSRSWAVWYNSRSGFTSGSYILLHKRFVGGDSLAALTYRFVGAVEDL
jgi:hypothetical protein